MSNDQAIAIILSMLQRTPMNPAEQAGTQAAIDHINEALKPKEANAAP